MMKLSQAAQILNAEHRGPDAEFQGVGTDSRKIKKGQVYIALRGEKFDGHDFINQAIQAGAAAVIVSRDETCTVPLLKVVNTRQALAELARFHRQQFNIPFIAVTGSCGKTTTKTLLRSVFAQAGPVLASINSFNNEIGVPLTLLELNSQHEYAVIEMGANHAGEIAFLTHLVHPDVAIITNAAAAHLEGFGSIEGVACAKGEIFQGLSSHGAAIINADDSHANFWRQLAGSRKILSFGVENTADVMARHIDLNENGQASFDLEIDSESIAIQLQLIGVHNIHNALAAAAAGHALGLTIKQIQAGLNAGVAEKNRLVEQRSSEGALIIDDSYNANPLSMLAAIRLLAQRSGERILVMGDMRELGEDSLQYHHNIGIEAKQMGIEQLYCYGDHSRHAAQAFGKKAYFFTDQAELIQALKSQLSSEVTMLVKGSRSMQMDKIVAALRQEP